MSNPSVREGSRGCPPLSMPDCYGEYNRSFFGPCKYCDMSLSCARVSSHEVDL